MEIEMSAFRDAVFVCCLCLAVYWVGKTIHDAIFWISDRVIDWLLKVKKPESDSHGP